MTSVQEQPWFIKICEELDAFCEKIDEKIEREQKQKKACEERNELEFKLAQERNLHAELTAHLAEWNRRGDDLERACTNFSKLTITENDQQRLDHTKEAFELAKELTGVRFDFSTPANIMKGYIKNEPRRLLLPFEMEIDPNALWDLMKTASDPSWTEKENRNPN